MLNLVMKLSLCCFVRLRRILLVRFVLRILLLRAMWLRILVVIWRLLICRLSLTRLLIISRRPISMVLLMWLSKIRILNISVMANVISLRVGASRYLRILVRRCWELVPLIRLILNIRLRRLRVRLRLMVICLFILIFVRVLICILLLKMARVRLVGVLVVPKLRLLRLDS